jgi:Zn-dependent protease with chaperone function
VGLINQVLVKLPLLRPIGLVYIDFDPFILVGLCVLMGLSPWLLDWLLTEFYGQKPLSKEGLNTYSREAIRVIQRITQQQHWHPPKLRILPMNAPIIFTYGNFSRTAHIAVSQGLLEQLADDEVATLYAFSLGQIKRWDLAVMSLVMVLTLPIYILYHQTAARGNRLKGRIGRGMAAILASLAYGLWCLLTGAALLNARWRFEDCDANAAEITGNPNGLIRALLKTAMGIARDTAKQEQSSWQLESLNILAPIGHQQSLSLGSIMSNLPWESFLAWERIQPYRHWLTVNQTHPLMGDRLERLCQIARQWHLETELHFTHQKPQQTRPQTFFLQIAPWLGIPLGYLLAIFLWLVWQGAYAIHLLNLKWIYVDWSFVPGFVLIGFSIGTLMRINYLFPDITPNLLQTENYLPHLFSEPAILPINSPAVRIVGKLLGRPGISNYLAQDLILQSHTGLVKLHHIPGIGQSVNPQDWIGRQIIVTGWFRRGATPWLDIQTIETQGGKTINSPHPILSIILAVATLFWGAFIILTGGN